MKEKEKKDLMKRLLREPVKNMEFNKNSVSFEFDGRKIKDRIVFKREPHVGEWSRKKNTVFIDKELERKRSIHAISLHEAIEKYLNERYGLKTQEEAHAIAEKKERTFLKSVGGNWRSHELMVYWLWHKKGEK
ncbi:MAG: hypothetical protein ABIE23_01590 [archaeon]